MQNSHPQLAQLKLHADKAFELAEPTILAAIANSEGRIATHVVMFDPSAPFAADTSSLPILKEQTFGDADKQKWAREFDDIARRKAVVCWRTGMSSRTVGEKAPYLYVNGDTKFPGGVICDGLIVATSGLEWQDDEAISHMVIALFWAQVRKARDRLMASEEISVS